MVRMRTPLSLVVPRKSHNYLGSNHTATLPPRHTSMVFRLFAIQSRGISEALGQSAGQIDQGSFSDNSGHGPDATGYAFHRGTASRAAAILSPALISSERVDERAA